MVSMTVWAMGLGWALTSVLLPARPASAALPSATPTVAAAVTTPGGFTSLAPSRLLDTRIGVGAPRGAVAPRGTVHLRVTGRGQVPATGVSAVVLNVTVTGATRPGFVTAYGNGTALPGASNLNFVAGQTVPNLVIAPVGNDGNVDLYNGSAGTVQLIADVSGWFAVAGTPMTAMVVGDSITQGSSGDFTWRYRLYKALTTAGVTVTFQGPYTDLFDNVASAWDNDHAYADPVFDQRHDARWGETLQTAAELIQSDVATYSPDYLLVLLGVNDMGWGISDAAGTQTSLRAFIAHARAAKFDERFIFGQIPPDTREQSDPAFASMITDYNSRLVAEAAALSTPQSPISVTDGGADINPVTDLWDGIHPNAQGEQKIAAGFADTFANDFGIGMPYPRPYPVVPLGPQTSPVLSAQPGDIQARLTWIPAPGATGYYIYIKNKTVGEASFTKLPIAIADSSWTVGGLVDGDTYQIYLGTTKGGTQGVVSNTVSVNPASAAGAPTGVPGMSSVNFSEV